jgi:hypothetical protein
MNINEILAAIALLTLMGTMIDIAYNYKKMFKDE